MTHSCVCHAPIIFVTWIVHACERKMTDSLAPYLVCSCVWCAGGMCICVWVCMIVFVCERVRVCVYVNVCVGICIHRRWVQCDNSRGQAVSTHYQERVAVWVQWSFPCYAGPVMCVTWLIHICDTAHSYVWHDVWHNSSYLHEFNEPPRHAAPCHGSSLICHMTHLYVSHDPFIMCETTHFKRMVQTPSLVAQVHSYVWRDPFVCVPWLRSGKIWICRCIYTHINTNACTYTYLWVNICIYIYIHIYII